MPTQRPTGPRRAAASILAAVAIFVALVVATTPREHRIYPEHNGDPSVIGPAIPGGD